MSDQVALYYYRQHLQDRNLRSIEVNQKLRAAQFFTANYRQEMDAVQKPGDKFETLLNMGDYIDFLVANGCDYLRDYPMEKVASWVN